MRADFIKTSMDFIGRLKSTELASDLELAIIFKTLLDTYESGVDVMKKIATERDAAKSEIARLKAIMLDEDVIWDAISDSIDIDWTPMVGARAVVTALRREINQGEPE